VDAQTVRSYIAGMSITRRASFLAILVFTTALVVAAHDAVAEDFSIGAIQVGKPWIRATPKGAAVAGAYLTISNRGTAPDKLLGGSSAAAGRFEVHSMVMEQGVAKMRPVEGGLEIKPGETVELKPGSFHIMLMDLKGPVEKGQKVKGTLQFEKAGKVDIEYTVEAIGAGAPAPAMHNH
jgi:periplasmic copper chaperone A